MKHDREKLKPFSPPPMSRSHNEKLANYFLRHTGWRRVRHPSPVPGANVTDGGMKNSPKPAPDEPGGHRKAIKSRFHLRCRGLLCPSDDGRGNMFPRVLPHPPGRSAAANQLVNRPRQMTEAVCWEFPVVEKLKVAAGWPGNTGSWRLENTSPGKSFFLISGNDNTLLRSCSGPRWKKFRKHNFFYTWR